MLTLDSNCCTAGVHVHSNHLVQAVVFLSLLCVGMCVCGYVCVCVCVWWRWGVRGGGACFFVGVRVGGARLLLLTRTQADCVNIKIVPIMIV